MKCSITLVLLFLSTWISAQNEYSLQFDGTNDYVDCGVPTGFSFDDLSVMCWIKTTATPGTYQGVVTKDCSGCPTDFSILAHVQDTGDISFGGDGLGEVSGGTINDGVWHHIAGTRDGSTGKLKLYIDGILIDSSTGGTSMISNSENLQFGRYLPSNPHYYQGQVDEISIWDIELTQNQIQYRMQFCPAGNETGLKGYWNLNEGIGSTANDATINNNDGILTNGVGWNSDAPSTCIQPDVRVESADLYIQSVTKGIIMKSPDGLCWKISINNSGTLDIVSTDCPE